MGHIISVITAVYNVENYVAEAIESVIAQDIGFQNIQLIMVDDGSADKSGDICDAYAAKYPDNIKVIHKENGGVSSARNEGLKYIKGKYVNFLDSDDKLSPNAFSSCARFLDDHPETDVAAMPLFFFDARKGQHMLNGKFDRGTRVIYLKNEWEGNIQLSMSSALIRIECLKGLQFDTRLSYAEDAQLLQIILSEKQTLGAVSEAKYYYRKRSAGEESAIQMSTRRPEWYLPNMKYYHVYTINYYLKKIGTVPEFIQNTLMYDLQWKVKNEIPEDVLSKESKVEYLDLMNEVLGFIGDKVIMAQKSINTDYKSLVYRIKYDYKTSFAQTENNYQESEDASIVLEFGELQKEYLSLEGSLLASSLLKKNTVLEVYSGKEIYRCSCGERLSPAKGITGELPPVTYFKTVIKRKEISEKTEIKFRLNKDGDIIELKNVYFSEFFPVTDKYKASYFACNGWIIKKSTDTFSIEPYSGKAEQKAERMMLRELYKTGGAVEKKALAAIAICRCIKPFLRKPVWLISDRLMTAGDNGEALFRYIRKEHPEIDARFVVGKKSKAYEELKKAGPVIAVDSIKHKVFYLLSDYMISSALESSVFNPVKKLSLACKNLHSKTKYVFLQHGITKDDMSQLLNRYNKNFAGFVTAAEEEFESIINGKYGYPKENVWLTGFPRFDRLYRNEQRWITIMPTWRKKIMGQFDQNTGKWSLGQNAEESSYIRFYRHLINSRRLLEAAEKLNYKIRFMPHPNMQPYPELFHADKRVEFLDSNTPYREVYAKSNLVVTDYSSAVFDFAYLRKPIIYTQFDQAEFFEGEHTYTKGYFDYERDGFGEVEYDLDSTVDRIIEYMENGCRLKDKYRERMDSFFAFDDQNNCRRVFGKLTESRA